MLHRWCAIKLLSGTVTERDQRRFENEVRLTAQLSHPNTVSIYDFGRADDGTFYYAMELLDGVTLQQLVDAEGPQSPSRVVHILEQLCAALREAHDAGLIHRDIKPDNIVLCHRGGVADVAKLLDFGLVAQVAANTNTDVVVGTPLYLSPEAIMAPNSVSARSDLYALGAVAYFLLTGTPVFHGTSVAEVCSQHLYAEPQPLGHIPADLERIVLDCLSKNPLERPESAADLARRLACCNDAMTLSQSGIRTIEPHVLACCA
jgi:serine/threonine-protein kinase